MYKKLISTVIVLAALLPIMSYAGQLTVSIALKVRDVANKDLFVEVSPSISGYIGSSIKPTEIQRIYNNETSSTPFVFDTPGGWRLEVNNELHLDYVVYARLGRIYGQIQKGRIVCNTVTYGLSGWRCNEIDANSDNPLTIPSAQTTLYNGSVVIEMQNSWQ